ncbi:MAG: TonB-dependent receptor plug domain-containing protein [Cyanophyceae cyanobacterium]
MKQRQLANCLGLLAIPFSLLAFPVRTDAEQVTLTSDSNFYLPANEFQMTPLAVTERLTQLESIPLQITNVQVNSTVEGIEVVLETGQALEGLISVEGNDLIIDIPNAQLQLPEGSFRQENPVEGIASVTVTPADANSVRVIITGVDGIPSGEVSQSQLGLTISATAPIPTIDIIVTAEKQPDPLQEVPISITAITEQEIEDGDITSFRDIAENTPNFTTYTPSRNFVTYSVRGLSNFNFISRDPVAFYVDDVPYDYVNFLGVELYDIERVETLRGPQATLYGRNAQAGVVNVITRPPAEELDFRGNIG